MLPTIFQEISCTTMLLISNLKMSERSCGKCLWLPLKSCITFSYRIALIDDQCPFVKGRMSVSNISIKRSA